MTDINVSAEGAQTIGLEAWLGGATVAEAAVEVYQRPDLLARIEEWQRRYERAEQSDVGERSAGEEDPLAALEAEGEALVAELEASKSVWFLRALSSDDERAVNEAHPLPEKPETFAEKPPFMQARPTDAQARAFTQAYLAWEERKRLFSVEHAAEADAYREAVTAALIARGAEKIVRALSRIEVGGEVIATSITLDQAQSLPARLGEVQVGKILEAIDAATNLEPSLPAPFSRRGSGTTQD
ncbi:hypothetical protein [Sanguibacter massiliensis]|uniref:hypothetical protein n=1 Tax=Sanguibacter massiliensis TaxID=1973217 RepID=UPI000C83A417|nr:hypothetical protein [Sanguibacter massiliensis]